MTIPGLTIVTNKRETYLVVREPDGDRELYPSEVLQLFKLADHYDMQDRVDTALAGQLRESIEANCVLRNELTSLQQTFELRYQADMRAIKRWQTAHPGNDLTWPDRADLVVWLLEQLDEPSHP